METALLVGIIITLVVRWVYLRERFAEMDERINALASYVQEARRAAERQIISEPVRATAAPPIPEQARPFEPAAPAPMPERAAPVEPLPPPMPERVATAEPADIDEQPPERAAPANIGRPTVEPATQPAFDWEELLGGNLLNKIGIFVLVIGLALLLAYSYRYLNPAGRDAIAVAIGASMLTAGVVFEKRDRYRIFSRGLIGGGWAALYFTAYAMQALAPARIIDSPWAGAILLLAVAIGMIVHSLRYRSETVTGMAYFMAFAALGITQVSAFSVGALIPLAASLLYVARKSSWNYMAVFGLIATYVVCATHPDLGTPLWQAQTLFAVYWVLFEAFDILSFHRAIAPLNAAGFLLLSTVKWHSDSPQTLWMLLAATAVAYVGSAALRARSNHWHVAATLTAGLGAAAIYLRLDHQWILLGLLIEAEIFHLAGIRLRAGYLRLLAAGLFGFEIFQLIGGEVVLQPYRQWTPVAALTAAVFYLNRFLRSDDVFYGYAGAAAAVLVAGFESPALDRPAIWLALSLIAMAFGLSRRLFDFRLQAYGLAAIGLGAAVLDSTVFSFSAASAFSLVLTGCALFTPPDCLREDERGSLRWAGSMLVTVMFAALLWRLLPEHYLGPGWMALALVLFELGRRDLPSHFELQSYGLGLFGALLVLCVTVFTANPGSPVDLRWIPAEAAGLAALFAVRARDQRPPHVRWCATLSAAAFACDAIWLLTPEAALAIFSSVFAVGMLYLGRELAWDDLHYEGLAIAGLALVQSWNFNLVRELTPWTACPLVIAAFYGGQFLFERASKSRVYCSLLGTSLLTLLLYFEVSGSLLTVAVGIEGVSLLIAGFPLRDRVLRLSGLSLLLACILKLFLWDLRHLETIPRILSFMVLGLFLVAVSWIYTRFREKVAQYL